MGNPPVIHGDLQLDTFRYGRFSLPLVPGVGAARHDITSMAKGFVCLNAVGNWASRKAFASTVGITLEPCHAVAVLYEAFTRHG